MSEISPVAPLLADSSPPSRRTVADTPFTRLARNRLAMFGLVVILLVTLLALLAPVLPITDPNEINTAARLKPPGTPGNLLGTDQLGRDILSRLIWGARVSLLVAVVAATIALTIGTLIGVIAGYFGGLVDNIFMRLIDVLLAFPYVLLAIALVSALGPGLVNAMIAIAIVNISFYARNVRSAVLSIKSMEYIEAARASGASHARIIFLDILPNIIAPILVLVSLNIGWMVTETAGLSFVGLGAQPPTSDWGSMLADGRRFILVAPHAIIMPGIAIVLLVFAFNSLGDGLRDALDPRLRKGGR
jgi:peptide/nickel transport system permease protein